MSESLKELIWTIDVGEPLATRSLLMTDADEEKEDVT